ncbi:MAG: ATPase [Sphingomonadales bacterium]|nr:ATPase [Sphingomonadales bacterium]
MTGKKFEIMRKAASASDGEAAAATGPSGDDAATTLPAPDFTAREAAWDDTQADEIEATSAPARGGWIVPAALVLLALAWTAWFTVANRGSLANGNPAAATALVGAWAPPVLLLAVLWLIVQRSSRREARRFGDAARLLSDESARLESRLVVVNQELSLAREFIAAQARDLESVGRRAVERLNEHGAQLSGLVQDNGARIDAIGNVSAAALENMERLRGQLPVMTSAAKDVTNHIGNAGRTAHAQLQDLIAGFNRLNEFGQASERQVIMLRSSIDEALEAFAARSTALDQSARDRQAALTQAAADFRAQLVEHQQHANGLLDARATALAAEIAAAREALDQAEAEGLTSLRARLGALRDEAGAMARSLRDGEAAALADWRTALSAIDTALDQTRQRLAEAEVEAEAATRARLATLDESARAFEQDIAARGERLDAESARRRTSAEQAEADAVRRMSGMLAALDEEIAARRARHDEAFAALSAGAETARASLGAVERQLAAVGQAGEDVQATLTARLDGMSARFAEARAALATTEAAIGQLTDGSVRLLELIQAGARHSNEDLVAAIGKGEARLVDIEARARALNDSVVSMHGLGAELSEYVFHSHERLADTGANLAALHDDLDARARRHAEALGGLEATLASLREALAALDAETGEAAGRARGELADAIGVLEAAARNAVAEIEQHGTEAIATVASRLGQESGEAIEKALRLHMAEVGGRLEQAAAHASGVSREAALQLRDQLAKVNELVGALESRVDHARARAEEQVDNDFARRAALITESLNSNAIDIAKALDRDVGDSAWASYLRGDRGIFTRRAVRLLDTGDARSVAQIYENDGEFRDHVAHYIHDFEAMLRQLLSTRDGHALGVTLLSSDMGKLYVALAQAIERLRA